MSKPSRGNPVAISSPPTTSAQATPKPAAVAITAEEAHRAARFERLVALLTILIPVAALIGTIFHFWQRGVTWLDLGLFVGMYTISLMGITLGYHRLFTHKSFQCVTSIRWLLAISGAMAAQGPLLFWVACHRKHHRCSDDAGDPHSPHGHNGGWLGVLQGAWHSHVGWMLSHKPENYFRLTPDLLRDRSLMRINRLYFFWLTLGILLPAVVSGLITQTWWGALSGLLWGGLVRLFFVHHSTWSINSICHLFGSSPFKTEDQSRNNLVCAVLTFGEGWHNNHHAFPTSARHGLRWWQFDPTYYTIKAMKWVHLAWDIRLPEGEQVAARVR